MRGDAQGQGYGLLGPLSPDLFLYVADMLDLPTLLAAHNVSNAWRGCLQRVWKQRYLALERVDDMRKWRLRMLDGEEEAEPEPRSARAQQDDEDSGPDGGGDEDAEVGEEGDTDTADESRVDGEGDGRGVSGPPFDIITQSKLALQSCWRDVFLTDVVDRLPDSSPLRDELLYRHRRVPLPRATDLVYAWGTRRDPPDWHALCALHVSAERNWSKGRVASTAVVPLMIPQHWTGCTMSDDDPGDDVLLFTASRPRADGRSEDDGELTDTAADPVRDPDREFVLIAIERRTGQIRYMATLPGPGGAEPDAQCVAAFEDVGIAYSYVNGEDGWETYISGRALARLCPGAVSARRRRRHLQRLGEFGASLHNLELYRCGGGGGSKDQGLGIAQFNYRSLEWERFTAATLDEEREWDNSIPIAKAWSAASVQTSPGYILLGTSLHQVNVYSKATRQRLCSIPAGVTHAESRTDAGAQVALFALYVPEHLGLWGTGQDDHGAELAVTSFEMFGYTSHHDQYWLAVKRNVWEHDRVTIENFVIGGKHLFIKIEWGGFLVVPHFEAVFALAAALPDPQPGSEGGPGGQPQDPAQSLTRARFIAQRSLLIDPGEDKFVSYAITRDRLVLNQTLTRAHHGQRSTATFVLDLSSLPLLDPAASSSLTIRGHVLRRPRARGVRILDTHVMGSYLYEYLQYPWPRAASAVREEDIRNDLAVGKVALRITSYEPAPLLGGGALAGTGTGTGTA